MPLHQHAPFQVWPFHHSGAPTPGQLRPTVQWQTFGHHFKPLRVMHVGCQEIQVSNENIRRNPRPGLAADPCSHTFQSKTPPAQHPSSAARCAVVAKRVE